MGEFFKGWRRKAGLVMLAMALLLTAVWMRSYVIRDEFHRIQNTHCIHRIVSRQGCLAWHRFDMPPTSHSLMFYDWPVMWFAHNDTQEPTQAPWYDHEIEWRWQLLGFDFGTARSRPERSGVCVQAWACPYWSLILPLTLLSGWLIVGKTPKPRAESNRRT